MSILHIVNKSPYEKTTLDTAVAYMQNEDAMVLIEDAVYAAAKQGEAAVVLAGLDVNVLGPDLAARGIKPEHLIDEVKVISYADFVDLVVAKTVTQSWL